MGRVGITVSVPAGLHELVERFDRDRVSYRSGAYNEAQARVDFINPFLGLLGWDVDNRQGLPEAYREVVYEDRVKVGGGTKAPDYGFYAAGRRRFFLEAKKPSVDIHDDVAPAVQLRRYAWSARLPLSLLTDFEELAVYDCRPEPQKEDGPATARLEFFTYDRYPEPAVWDAIYSTFSREAVLDGSLEKYAEKNKRRRGTETVDAAFLREIEGWRDALARNLALRNDLNGRGLNFAVQMTIDRIIFLRMAEDRGIEEYGRLLGLTNGPNVYARLRELFREADERYNSGLFHFRRERGRDEEPDDLTLSLNLDDEVLRGIIRGLYYPESPYEFSVLPVDVLGQVYEQFLGKVIRLTEGGHRAKVEEKPEVRKAGGVYYTPTYIVDYIVEKTVGKLLEGKRPGPRGGASRLKIVDPACGSGSFLIGAYTYLLDWHRDRYVEDGPEKWSKVLYRGRGDQWHLTIDEKKRILLNSIHGVDIDPQAVEVTKLSLLLKVLEGESEASLATQLRMFQERALPDLDRNIKCGNSLIGPDFYDNEQMMLLDEEEHYRINVFDWKTNFPQVFEGENPGFDAVIGNPPYIFTRELLTGVERRYFSAKYQTSWEKQNTYMLFIELMLQLLGKDGLGGYIVPNSWLTIESARLLRTIMVPKLELVTDLNYTVFNKVSMEPCIFTVSGSKSVSPVSIVQANSRDSFAEAKPQQFKRERWSGPEWRVVFSGSDASAQVIDKVIENSKSVGQVFDVRSGLQAYEKGRGKPPQTTEDVKYHVFDRNQREDEDSVAYLGGSDVKRYRLQWSGLWMQYGPWLSQPREYGIFSRPRVLLREITSDLPYCLNANYVEDVYLNNKSVLNILAFDDNSTDLKCLLAILNSRLISLYYKQRAVKSARKIFPKVVIKNLKEFPYPIVESAERKELVNLVDRMQSLQEGMAEAKLGRERTVIGHQIEATDRQIDRLVYELYDLTDEEIGIVEEVTVQG
jgi:predicted type IV restriction endonuclease